MTVHKWCYYCYSYHIGDTIVIPTYVQHLKKIVIFQQFIKNNLCI